MGLLLTCKHYTSLKTTCQSRQLLYIPGEIETRGKNKKKTSLGKKGQAYKKNSFGLPEKKYDILL